MITLQTWAKQKFRDCVPHVNTQRKWAREGEIYPPPTKIGRTWWVDEAARHIAEIVNGSKITIT